ncbi:hypothetical protein scyTo_0023251, partial [Scyliorhinus torazame]|nr:hypothetical protein [Scyliorhinus torazame]
DMFDPHGWSEESYYEALAKAQKIEMDKIEKAKKERTKIPASAVICFYPVSNPPLYHLSFMSWLDALVSNPILT